MLLFSSNLILKADIHSYRCLLTYQLVRVLLCNTKPNNVASLAGKLGAFCHSNYLADIFSAMLVTMSAFQNL